MPKTKAEQWTTADSIAAQREGWDVFETGQTDDHAEIQADDEAAIFELDGDALEHVIDEADTGSELHMKALRIHNSHNE